MEIKNRYFTVGEIEKAMDSFRAGDMEPLETIFEEVYQMGVNDAQEVNECYLKRFKKHLFRKA